MLDKCRQGHRRRPDRRARPQPCPVRHPRHQPRQGRLRPEADGLQHLRVLHAGQGRQGEEGGHADGQPAALRGAGAADVRVPLGRGHRHGHRGPHDPRPQLRRHRRPAAHQAGPAPACTGTSGSGPPRTATITRDSTRATWRNYRAFGTGTVGDMACHWMDFPFWGLKVYEVKKFSRHVPRHQGRQRRDVPLGQRRPVRPARARLDTRRPVVRLRPHARTVRRGMEKKFNRKIFVEGSLIVGDKGSMTNDARTIPEELVKDLHPDAQDPAAGPRRPHRGPLLGGPEQRHRVLELHGVGRPAHVIRLDEPPGPVRRRRQDSRVGRREDGRARTCRKSTSTSSGRNTAKVGKCRRSFQRILTTRRPAQAGRDAIMGTHGRLPLADTARIRRRDLRHAHRGRRRVRPHADPPAGVSRRTAPTS